VTTLAVVGRRRASIDIGAQIAGRVFNLALGVLVTALIVRALGQGPYGQWATAMAIMQLAMQFGTLGMDVVAVRSAASDPENESTWLGAQLLLRVLAGVPVALGCAVAIVLISSTDDMKVAGLLMTATLVTGTLGSLQIAWQLRVRNDVNVAFVTLGSFLWTGAVIAVAASDGGMVPLAAAFLAVNTLTSLLQAGLVLRRVPVRLRGTGPALRRLARLTLPVGIGTLLMYAYGQVDQVLVYQVGGDEQAGLYGSVYRILASAMVVPGAVMLTLFPIIAAARASNPERVRRLLRVTADYLAMVSLPAFAFTLAAADPIVRLLYGDDFAGAANSLRILMAAFVPVCFMFLSGNMLIALGRQRALIGSALAALAVNVALNLALLPHYGYVAAAWATLATELLVLGLTARIVLRDVGGRLRPGRIPKASIAAAAMGALVGALNWAGAPLVALLGAAAVAYPALLLAVRAVERDELRALAHRESPA
jgi:O-antigen/teichoic acid export membrane protein